MKYISQLDYEHIVYHTNVKNDEVSEKDRIRNVALSGCGPCCVCMVVDSLTTNTLGVEECIAIAEECESNYGKGTDMRILAPLVAKKYNLGYLATDDINDVIVNLQKGAMAIANMSVQVGDTIGLFTKSGHYITLISTDGKDFCIFDPSYTPEKYDIPERKGRIDTSHAPFLYCDIETVSAESTYKSTKYHIFWRKK